MTPQDIWKDTLNTQELDPPLVCATELDEVIDLMIASRIDHQRFIGNLTALLYQGRTPLFQQSSDNFPTTQSIEQLISPGKRPQAPLWLLSAFPDVMNWFSEKQRALMNQSASEDQLAELIVKMFKIDSQEDGSFDEKDFLNELGQFKVKYFKNLIENYQQETGKTLEAAVSKDSQSDIYLASEIYKSVGAEDLFTLIASNVTKYYIELRRQFLHRFPTETSLLSAAGILAAQVYILKTREIKADQIVAVAVEAKDDSRRFLSFVISVETLLMSVDNPNISREDILASCQDQEDSISKAIDSVKQRYESDTRVQQDVRSFMESRQFAGLRTKAGISAPDRDKIFNITNVGELYSSITSRKFWNKVNPDILRAIFKNAQSDLTTFDYGDCPSRNEPYHKIHRFVVASEIYRRVEKYPSLMNRNDPTNALFEMSQNLNYQALDLLYKVQTESMSESKALQYMAHAELSYQSAILCDPFNLSIYASLAGIYLSLENNKWAAVVCKMYDNAETHLLHDQEGQLNYSHEALRKNQGSLLAEVRQEIDRIKKEVGLEVAEREPIPEDAESESSKKMLSESTERMQRQFYPKLFSQEDGRQIDSHLRSTPPSIGGSNRAESQSIGQSLPFPAAPSGIGGWLLYYCIALTILNPIYFLIQLFVSYFTTTDLVGSLVETFLILGQITYFLIIGIRLWQRKEKAVRQTKIFLMVIGLLSILELVYVSISSSASQADASNIQADLKAIISSVIWFIYFSRSKRVKNTFKLTTLRKRRNRDQGDAL